MTKTRAKKAPPPADDEVFQLRVGLGVSPHCVWRRVLISTRARLSELHEVLQVVMGWRGAHLHGFDIDGKSYGAPQDDGITRVYDESKPSLASRVDVGDVFTYEYDFGDGWEHEIRVEAKLARVPGQAYPICIGGRLACPPEDCGGFGGYVDIVDALLDATGEIDPELSSAYAGYDPDAFSIEAVNRALHGKETAAPRDPTLDPRLDTLASSLNAVVHAWWLRPEGRTRDELLGARALGMSLCAALAEHPDSAAQLDALDDHCSGRLRQWLLTLPVALASAGDLDLGLGILEAATFVPPQSADQTRIDAYVAAGRHDEARAAIDAALAAHGRDGANLLGAAMALSDMEDWARAEPIARELFALPGGDLVDRSIASSILMEALRKLGRAEEADALEASLADEFADDEFEDDDFEDDDFDDEVFDGDDGSAPKR